MWNRSIVSQLKAEYAGLLYSFHQMQGFRLYCFSPTPFFPFSRCNLSLKFHSSQRRCLCSLTMTHEPEIQSLKNPRVKAARALIRRRQREKENKILLEGQRLISDALEKGVVPLDFYYTKEGLERNEANFLLLSKMRSKGASHILVSDPVIRSFSDTTNPQGLVGIFASPKPALPKSPTLALICDEIRDPGNLGSLLRSAAAAGVQAVALTRGCADAWGLKALRSGMGAQFRVPITSDMEWSQIRAYCDATKMNIKVAEGSSKLSYTQIDWRAPSALVIGSEAQGPSVEAFKAAHHKISIPMSDHVESLNAAMAGAVILFEAKRQREMTVS